MDLRRVGLFLVAGFLQRSGQGRGKGVALCLEIRCRQAAAIKAWQHPFTNADLRHVARLGRFVGIGDGPLGQQALGDIARAGEFGLAHRVELERALGRVCHHHYRVLLLGDEHVRVAVLGQCLEYREVGQRGDDATGHDDFLAADAVGQAAEEDEERCADQQRTGNQQVGGLRLDLEHLQQEEQRIELPGVPHHGLAGGAAEQRHDHHLEVVPAGERFGQWRLGRLALGLHLHEHRRLVELHADVHRNCQQQYRQQERHPPAPGFEHLVPHGCAAGHDHQQREEQPQGGRGLDPGGEETAPALGCMLGHIGGRAAVLATQCQALQQAQADENDRRSHADRGIAG
ncbi:hypothetical protein D3C71_1398910 [compost metagenome]